MPQSYKIPNRDNIFDEWDSLDYIVEVPLLLLINAKLSILNLNNIPTFCLIGMARTAIVLLPNGNGFL